MRPRSLLSGSESESVEEGRLAGSTLPLRAVRIPAFAVALLARLLSRVCDPSTPYSLHRLSLIITR